MSQGSLIDLKAALYEEEESVKRRKLGQPDERKERLKRQRGRLDPKFCGASGSNAGVADRDARDAAERAAESRGVESVADALARKALLYEQMQSSTASQADACLDGGKYLIDFFVKGGEQPPPSKAATPFNDHTPWGGGGGSRAVAGLEMVSADMRQEAERQDWEADSKNEGMGEASRRANVEMLKQLTADTASERRKKTGVKAAREASKLARRAKLVARKQKRAASGSFARGLSTGIVQDGESADNVGETAAGQGDISALATLLTEEEKRKEEEQRAAAEAQRVAAAQAKEQARRIEEQRAAQEAAAKESATQESKTAEAAQWEALRDPATGRLYFHHKGRKHTQWECPVGVKLQAPPSLPHTATAASASSEVTGAGTASNADSTASITDQVAHGQWSAQQWQHWHWQQHYAQLQHQQHQQPHQHIQTMQQQPQLQPQLQQPQQAQSARAGQADADRFLAAMTATTPGHAGASDSNGLSSTHTGPTRMAMGGGRGRDMTRPAWMTQQQPPSSDNR